jgi:hypothetical protein
MSYFLWPCSCNIQVFVFTFMNVRFRMLAFDQWQHLLQSKFILYYRPFCFIKINGEIIFLTCEETPVCSLSGVYINFIKRYYRPGRKSKSAIMDISEKYVYLCHVIRKSSYLDTVRMCSVNMRQLRVLNSSINKRLIDCLLKFKSMLPLVFHQLLTSWYSLAFKIHYNNCWNCRTYCLTLCNK